MEPTPSIQSSLPDASAFPELDPGHPGATDRVYRERRRALFEVAHAYRTAARGIPIIEYTDDEHRVWRHVYSRLEESHARTACSLYLDGKRRLGFDPEQMPQLFGLNAASRALGGLGLVPAEGVVPVREFFDHLAQGEMPCTQYLRHGSQPEFTPEPDAVHDILGHVPLLLDPRYAAIVREIGRAGAGSTDGRVEQLSRLYWFTIEFGLIEEAGGTRIFGAGLLSSFGEMRHALSDDVVRRPFDLDDVLATEYDSSRMQDKLFVLPSLDALEDAVARLGGRPSTA